RSAAPLWPISALLFAPWNHHAPHSTSKMDSKWDCRSSTQSFAIGSYDNDYLRALRDSVVKNI
ncbi:MAG: hypothetical protein Q9M31_10575, partial [Mariprofundus sp.]|nr:hypothetical protein [Mariprofundus sp.]